MYCKHCEHVFNSSLYSVIVCARHQSKGWDKNVKMDVPDKQKCLVSRLRVIEQIPVNQTNLTSRLRKESES